MSGFIEEVRAFIEEEARRLDQRRFADWLALYADDAVYWIPRQRGQTDPLAVPSIIYEDRPLLAMRVARLADPAMHSAQPAAQTLHIVSSIEIATGGEAGRDCRVTSAQLVVSARDGDTRLYAARCEHLLRRREDGLVIARKRIDLVDCDGPHPPLSILL